MWHHAPDGMLDGLQVVGGRPSMWPSEDVAPHTITINGHACTGGASVGSRYHPHDATGYEGRRKDEQRKVSDSHKNKDGNKS